MSLFENDSAVMRLAAKTKKKDHALLELAGRLDWSPKKNWVENEGGLPKYIEDVAIGIMKSGKSRENAIQIAISRIKVWAAGGGDVNPDTRAKAAAALAQWERMKASAAAKRAASKTK